MPDGSIKPREVSTPADARAKPARWIGLDTETVAFDDDDPCPAVVCLQLYSPELIGAAAVLYAAHPDPALDQVGPAWEWVLRTALETSTTIVGWHLPFDIGALLAHRPDLTPLVFELLDRGLFECALLRDKLDDIARGTYDNEGKQRWHDLDGEGRKPYGYSLKDAALIRLGRVVDKGEDTYRGRFGEFYGTDPSTWPASAVAYALGDSELAHAMAAKQHADEVASPARAGCYVYADAPAQTRMGVSLMLMRVWGVRTDPVQTSALKVTLEARTAAVLDDLIAIKFVRPGYMRPRAKTWVEPSKDTKKIMAAIEAACATLGRDVVRTPTGRVSMSGESIDALAGADPNLDKVIEFSAVQKVAGYVTILASGHEHAIHSEPNTLVANGRTSWGSASPDGAESPQKVNLQNLPTEPGVRECYVPRGFGTVLFGDRRWYAPDCNLCFAIDYSTLELCTVAQVCLWLLGRSRLAELINSGVDMHCMLGELFVGMSYDELVAGKKAEDPFCVAVRDACKRANFGFWGGMGIPRFMSTCREVIKALAKVGVVFDEAMAYKLKRAWQSLLPETYPYFEIMGAIDVQAGGSGQIVQYVSERIRGGLGYCDAANTFFSGLAADGVKDATYHATREQHAVPSSPLFGSRFITVPHDELVGEAHRTRATAAAERCRDIMVERMRVKVPDVKIKCSIALMHRWRKGASEYRVEGELRPHEESPTFLEALSKGEVFL